MTESAMLLRIVAGVAQDVATNGTPKTALHEMCKRLLNVVEPSEVAVTLEALVALERISDAEVAALLRGARLALQERTRHYTQL